MRSFLRKCRGVLGIAMTWGVVWAAVFIALGLIAELVHPGSIDPGEGPMTMVRVGAGYGYVSGAVFGVLLSLGEGSPP